MLLMCLPAMVLLCTSQAVFSELFIHSENDKTIKHLLAFAYCG